MRVKSAPRADMDTGPDSSRGPSFWRNHDWKFIKDVSGATSIEYGLIAAGVALTIISVVNGLRTSLNAKFKSISTQLK